MGSGYNNLIIRSSYEAIMAGSTGWSLKIFANSPGNIIPVPFMLFREENVSVFTFFVNLKRRHVWLNMALRTGIRFSGYLYREIVSWMACCTCPQATIGINPSYSLVR